MMDHLNQQQQQEQQSQQRYTKLWDSALGLNKNINAHNYIKKESFFNKNLMKQYLNVLSKMNVSELFEVFPYPKKGTDVIQIYNIKAYNELIHTFMTEPNRIHICANGGSSTAGGGHVAVEHRYYSKLVQYLREVRVNSNGAKIEILERGHGTRHSLHSAVFAPSFIPSESDLILWEFAINDYGYHIPKQNIVEQERSILLAWLSEIQRLRTDSPPPKVILIYLWKTPFYVNEQGEISDPVYNAHADLAREFDFVVGHVNVASYIEDLELKKPNQMKRLFLADRHHPNEAGHLVISFLLLNLLRGVSSSSSSGEKIGLKKQRHSEQYEWFCGTENEDKRFVRSQIVQYNSEDDSFQGWRSPLGVSTMEEPQNDINPGSRQLVFDDKFSSNSKMMGKQDPLRIDRLGSAALSCCSSGDNTSVVSGYTSVNVPEGGKPMNDVQSLFLGFALGFSDIKNLNVYIGSAEQNANVDGRLIRVLEKEWPCFWSWQDIYSPMWFAFSEQQTNVSNIYLCVESDNCDEEGKQEQNMQSQAFLISVAVY